MIRPSGVASTPNPDGRVTDTARPTRKARPLLGDPPLSRPGEQACSPSAAPGASSKSRPATPAKPGLSRLLSPADVAGLLQVSIKTVRRWIEAGELRVHALGRQLRVSEDDLSAFVKSRRR